MKIITNQQEVEYKGLYFSFKILKDTIKRVVPHELLQGHCIHRKFNPNTGEIERKYAWDAVFEDLSALGILQEILDDLIHKEYLE